MPTVQANGIDIYYEVQGEGAGPLTAAIPGAEVVVFENCSHAPIYEDVAGFNQRTLAFLRQHSR